MIKLELEGEEWNLPSGWNEVNIDTFEEIVRLAGIYEEYDSEIQYTLDLVSALTGAPVEKLKKITRASFEELSKSILWTNDKPEARGADEFRIGDEIWKVVKNLDKLEMGDVISLELMIKESNEGNILGNILPILVRKGGKFDSDNYEENRNLLKKELKVTDVIGLQAFFLNGEK